MPQAVLDAPSVSSSGLVGWEWCFEAQSLLQGTGACRFRKVPHRTSPLPHRPSPSPHRTSPYFLNWGKDGTSPSASPDLILPFPRRHLGLA